jgi:thymidylate synthase
MKFGWSYGERLFDYGGVDQVRGVISKLKGKPETKAAVLTLLDPQQDSKSSHVPCITSLDFKVRNKRLVTYAIFRSQDVGKKTYADMIAIGKLQKLISGSVGVQPGRLTLFITSAHIYKADIPAVSSVIRQIRCSRQ